MLIFPAIDLFDSKAVRLFKGDYDKMTVYSNSPVKVSLDFVSAGAEWVHVVDLEGARSGGTPNFETVIGIKKTSGLKCEIGGGIRSLETAKRYLDGGIDRVIVSTAAVEDPDFLERAVAEYGDRFAVSADVKDGYVATRGWLRSSGIEIEEFCRRIQSAGVGTLICTDVSRDGAMKGTNRALYAALNEKFRINVIASGGVSTIEDVKALREMDLYGAIIGKAYYTGAIDLKEAIEAAK
ncbi:MAG: 1-(5-phosphoribosyl)-5-[Clostridia bacterium]|nr:1-(5-phosphoribosyl)-5-[(5-phosphoribosylamino)methylideneamino]imidazole-4-carboxamide isomerase [Clostridia bacterium]